MDRQLGLPGMPFGQGTASPDAASFSRRPIIAGNWKMNTSIAEAVELVHGMIDDLIAIRSVEVVICPPFISLFPVYEMLRGELVAEAIGLGAQNMDHRESGAFTGEVSGRMLMPICTHVILGHSERRQYFGETDESVNLKVKSALRFKLRPIVCVGERLEEREGGQTDDVIVRQLRGAFADVADPGSAIVAYEPVWAIGTGRAATGEQANETVGLIRRTFRDLYGDGRAASLRIQYGGSVTAANIGEFIRQPEIDGALVGGASLKRADFVAICQAASDAKAQT